MAKTRAIVKRRKAVRNIRKITRTMELIATARFKKALDRAVSADAFTRKISELVTDLASGPAAASHPLLQPRENPKKAILLTLNSNRGLCGGYNANVLRLARKTLQEATIPTDLETSGKRGAAFFRFQGVAPTKSYVHFEDKPTFAEVDELASRYLTMFLKGEIDRLDVVYTRFLSISRQVAEVVTLLPMSAPVPAGEGGKPTGKQAEYEFIPSAEDILDELVPTSFKVRLFKFFLDAAVSEQISRMIAMKGATENAGDLIKDLTQKYNRARQSQITSEIAEIIGAVEALS
ncbi:MAG TPA: ATP synthase F1 subunit gamma [Planctomycetia bacterium]|nr:ATP synthase F1 subunit gamma [Planctomycetia bacterium]